MWTEQSDVPDHEGPTHHAPIDLWLYPFPLVPIHAERLTTALSVISPLLAQARSNLTGNAADSLNAGIAVLQKQEQDLATLATITATVAYPTLAKAIRLASEATASFVAWLKESASSKTGPSGIGVDQYNRYLRGVHLVPLDWTGEAVLHKRELARAHVCGWKNTAIAICRHCAP